MKSKKNDKSALSRIIDKVIGYIASIIGGLLFYVPIGYFVWIPGQNEGFI